MIEFSSEFHMACEQLEPLIYEARSIAPRLAEQMLQPANRFERILLMPRRGGKTSIMESSVLGEDEPLSLTGGWLDEAGQPHSELARTAIGMLKVYREHREQFPKYSPKITLRPETWDAIKSRLRWVEQHQVASLTFPQDAFYGAFAELGATPDALAHFGPTWLKTFTDAAGRLYPGLAFDALRLTCEKAHTVKAIQKCKWQGAAEACAAFVQAQQDIRYWVTYMVPGDRATITGGKFTIPMDRFQLRIRQARRDRSQKLPYELTGPQFARWGIVAGIWSRVSGHLSYSFALPYSIGASFLKASLTDAALRSMSKE